MFKIFFSNIGYARDIDGSLRQHVTGFYRNFYNSLYTQKKVLRQVRDIIEIGRPDLCCFVEVDLGSYSSAYLNQLDHISDDMYHYYDAANKYGTDSLLSWLPFHQGKANGFLSCDQIEFERLYMPHGSKRLIYKLYLPNDIVLYFMHFSLKRKVREKQFCYMNTLIKEDGRPTMILADFNIFTGFDELKPLVEGTDLQILNDEDRPTFLFYNNEHVLDLCLCSAGLADYADLDIIDQPYSDHQALMIELDI